MGRSHFLSSALAVAAAVVLVASQVNSAEKTGADLLPASTVVYAQVNSPTNLLELIQGHPMVARIQQMEEYTKLTEENPDYLKARAGVGIFEFVVGRDWDEAIRDISGDGIYLGFDAETEGAVVIAQSPDGKTLSTIRDRLIKAAKDDAERKGKALDFEEHTYRDHTIYKFDKAIAGVIGQWLVITNKPALGRVVADSILDGRDENLTSQEKFQKAKASVTGEPVAWAYVDVAAVRDAGLAKELYKDKSNNPGVELLVGGILGTLQQADSATAAIYLDDDGIRLALNLPHDAAQIPARREFYFGEKGKGAAVAPLAPKNQLFSLTSYRDVGEMWRRRSDLFDENVNAELAKADSNLSTVFAGLDFGREVLGSLQPQVQFIATAQSFDNRETRVPQIKLPAAAMVFQLKEPEKMQRQLKVSFQSLIGLTNLGAGQNDLPQLELKTESVGDGQVISATYENVPADEEVSNDIIYNFSPSLAFVDDHFIIASTRELAGELMDLAKDDGKPLAENGRIVNTRMTLSSDALRGALAINREALISQNMLENGHTRREAEKEIGVLMSLLKFAGDASVELATSDETLRLEAALRFAKP